MTVSLRNHRGCQRTSMLGNRLCGLCATYAASLRSKVKLPLFISMAKNGTSSTYFVLCQAFAYSCRVTDGFTVKVELH